MEHPDRAAHFVPACAVEMDMDFAHGTVYARNYNENAANHDRGVHLVRACAVEMHMDISQGHFYARICSEKTQNRWSTLI